MINLTDALQRIIGGPVGNAGEAALRMLLSFWWLWMLVILASFFMALWRRYRINLYLIKEPAVVLEVRIPREIIRGPKAMEQILANFHGLANKPDTVEEKYVDGEVPRWFGLEIASFGGDVRFYIYTPKRHQSMVEAHVYAQYPDIEIAEVADDYTARAPATLQELYAAGYDLFGTEFILAREDVYPIRTYTEFESSEDASNLDPISALIENLAKIKPEEQVWVQVLIRPASFDWAKKGRDVIEQMKERATKTQKITNAAGVTEERTVTQRPSPGEAEAIKAIEANVSKPGFETLIRQIYIAPRAAFNMNFAKRAVFSSLNQYKSEILNYFKNNGKVRTLVNWSTFPHVASEKRANARKARVLMNYRLRYIPDEFFLGKLLTSNVYHWNFHSKTFVMNTEELATIYHFPTLLVLTAPFIKRVESRKIGPPAGLPIFPKGAEKKLPFQFGGQKEE